MTDEPQVSIVLLNWNNYQDTADCIDSLQNITYGNTTIVVVDNGSQDGSGTKLAEEYEECNFIFNDENLGFSGGCNVGIDYSIDNGADYVLLLNNDITVSPGFLEPLVETAERHSNVAAVGGVIYQGQGPTIWDAGGKMRPYIANVTRFSEIKSDDEYETEFVTCAQALLSREFLNDHRLDETYFFGVEEIDLSWRAGQDGWKLYTNPNSEVYHDVGGSTEEMFADEKLFSSFQKYHNTRGRLYFASKHLDPLNAVSYYVATLTVFPLFYLWLWIRFGRKDILYTHFLSIYDYLLTDRVRKTEYFSD